VVVLSEHDLDVVRLYVFAREANLSVPASFSPFFFCRRSCTLFTHQTDFCGLSISTKAPSLSLLWLNLVSMLFDGFNESREIYHDGGNGILINEALVYTARIIRREGCDGRETFADHHTANWAKPHNIASRCVSAYLFPKLRASTIIVPNHSIENRRVGRHGSSLYMPKEYALSIYCRTSRLRECLSLVHGTAFE
jgi:hypothetical protein